MKVIRVLEYEGPEEWIQTTLSLRSVRVVQRAGPERWIRERYVMPDPVPYWWDAIIRPGVEEKDPTEGGE